MIDELSIVSSDLWTDSDSRLEKIFMIIEKVFPCLSVITVADLFQLPPVRWKLLFLQFSDKNSMEHLSDL